MSPEKTEKTEKIISAITPVFLRLGYKKVTMTDLAEAASMSRPAFYLVLESKESAFRAVLNRYFVTTLADLQTQLPTSESIKQQLTFALEVWCVRPFEMTIASPDTKDLLESGYAFANDLVVHAFDEFEAFLARILDSLQAKRRKADLSSEKIAHLLVSSAIGFKQVSEDADALRDMISQMLTLILAGMASTSVAV